MEEERENNSKATSHEKGNSADGWAGLPQEINLPSAYATLLDQYHEALARIHVLEMQNQNLVNMVKLSPLPIVSQDGRASTGAHEATDLVARIHRLGCPHRGRGEPSRQVYCRWLRTGRHRNAGFKERISGRDGPASHSGPVALKSAVQGERAGRRDEDEGRPAPKR